jgi:hypothetical protein
MIKDNGMDMINNTDGRETLTCAVSGIKPEGKGPR